MKTLAVCHLALFLVCNPSMCTATEPDFQRCLDIAARVERIVYELAIPSLSPGPYEEFSGKQARLMKELEKMGIDAVPYLVDRLDDRRRLPFRYLALENKAINRFEVSRQYSPELVVDAIAALLNQLTGENFEFIYNGGSDISRSDAVKGWRKYMETTFYKSYPTACRILSPQDIGAHQLKIPSSN